MITDCPAKNATRCGLDGCIRLHHSIPFFIHFLFRFMLSFERFRIINHHRKSVLYAPSTFKTHLTYLFYILGFAVEVCTKAPAKRTENEIRRPRPSHKLLSRRTLWLSLFGQNRPDRFLVLSAVRTGGAWDSLWINEKASLCCRGHLLCFIIILTCRNTTCLANT